MKRTRWLLLTLFACGSGKGESAEPSKPSASTHTPTATTAAPTSAASCGAAVPDVVATVAGVPITRDELFGSAPGEIIEAEVAVAQAREDALDALLMKKLIDLEATKRATTPEALVDQEIREKMLPVTPEDIATFYEQNRARMQGPLEAMSPQIQQYLQQDRAGTVLRDLVKRLEGEHGVTRKLEPYRVTVAPEDSPRKGNAAAPIQIVEFSDFQCPYCSVGADTLRQVEARYGDQVSVVFRHYPLPFHDKARRAAEASECADDQGGFWPFHDALFADQKSWSDEDLRGYAKKAGLDGKDFDRCLEAGVHTQAVSEDIEAGRLVGMNGTPGFYINGVVVSGAQPIEKFVAVIDAELARVR